jgi:cysteinyl-tRNA synthetase
MRIDMNSLEVQRFQAAMDDDFNTPGGVAVLFELAKELQKEGNRLTHEGKTAIDAQALRSQWQTMTVLAAILGLEPKLVDLVGSISTTTGITGSISVISDAEIEAKIQQRKEARQAKNWAEGDQIRDELKAQGITLIDKPGGITNWIRD